MAGKVKLVYQKCTFHDKIYVGPNAYLKDQTNDYHGWSVFLDVAGQAPLIAGIRTIKRGVYDVRFEGHGAEERFHNLKDAKAHIENKLFEIVALWSGLKD